ncbi:hypothetical protein ACLB2K_013910 [Fragaria x ananassa]
MVVGVEEEVGRWKMRERDGGVAAEEEEVVVVALIDALGRLLTHILRHMASELNLDMRSDGFVKVHDVLKLNLKTFANIPLSSHTVDEIKEAVRRVNKQRCTLLEENEVPVCVHGTYRKNWDSILENALAEGMKFYSSDNKVILTEGFDGVVPVNVAASAKTLDEGQTKWFGRKAVNYLLITVTGGVALSALDDLIIYQSCSSKAMKKASKDPAIQEALGEPVLKGPWYNAQLGVAHKRQSVSCKFPVYGPKGQEFSV